MKLRSGAGLREKSAITRHAGACCHLFVSEMGNSVARLGGQERQQAAKMYGAEGAAAEGAARTFEPDEELADAEAAAGAEGCLGFVAIEAAPSWNVCSPLRSSLANKQTWSGSWGCCASLGVHWLAWSPALGRLPACAILNARSERAISAGSTCEVGRRTLPSRVVVQPLRDGSRAA